MQYESIINIFYIYLLYIYLTDLVADGICVTQDFTVVKTHWTVHLRSVHLSLCKLYFIFKGKTKMFMYLLHDSLIYSKFY